MTHEDIIAAAFRIWGREAYRKMSLTDVAAGLGVTKPALYRHFKGKDDLLAAMQASFFDRYAAAMKATFPAGLVGTARSPASTLKFVEAMASFFGASPGDLAFMFARILRLHDSERVFMAELAARGVATDTVPSVDEPGNLLAQMAIGTCFFMVASFHLGRLAGTVQSPRPPSSGELSALVDSILGLVAPGLERGLGRPTGRHAGRAAVAGSIDYAALEARASLSERETRAPDGLLPAVAAVVAEVGSWNASMEMVARRSGLSKSGLYSHFSGKEDMLLRLFSVEFERISDAVAVRLPGVDGVSGRLYLAMSTAAGYLLARPDILVALDWLRTQRMGPPELLPPRLLELFSFLDGEVAGLRLVGGSLGLTVRWILFMTVQQLMYRPGAGTAAHVARLRLLHAFILDCLGRGIDGTSSIYYSLEHP